MLADNAPFRSNGFTGDEDPSAFDDASTAAEGAAAGACEGVVPKAVQSSTTTGSRAAGATARACQRERQPQTALRVCMARIAGDGREPRAGMRAGLGTEQGLGWR